MSRPGSKPGTYIDLYWKAISSSIMDAPQKQQKLGRPRIVLEHSDSERFAGGGDTSAGDRDPAGDRLDDEGCRRLAEEDGEDQPTEPGTIQTDSGDNMLCVDRVTG